MADDAGAMLVRSGLVSAEALAAARAAVEQAGGTIGEQLVGSGAVSDDALTDFYRQRLLVPMVNPNSLARLSAKVVAVIPGDMAVELRAVPVSLDAENNLTVAMSDPSDRRAVDEIAFFTGAYVVRAVATQMQIAWCLAHYYGHVTPLGTRLMQPDPAAPTAPAQASPPRPRGYTAKVNATRHRALAPITSQVLTPRPDSKLLDDPTPSQPSAVAISLPGPDVGPEPVVIQPAAAVDSGPTPRARTASGEIKIPRAQSVKPPLPPDESGPVITIEVADEATGPRVMPPPRRKTPARTDPPELAARAGEVSIRARPAGRVELETPSIVISEDAHTPTIVVEAPPDFEPDAPVAITSTYDRESQPILLERKRPSEPPQTIQVAAPEPPPEEEDDDEVIELAAPKKSGPQKAVRPEKRTQVGMGAVTAATAPTSARSHRDTEADGMPQVVDDTPTSQVLSPRISARIDAVIPFEEPEADAPTRVDASAAAGDAATLDEDDPIAEPPPPAPTAAPAPEPEAPRKTLVGTAAPAPAPPRARRISYDPTDDGWGDPGSTHAPPLLGAMPGADAPSDGSTIPIQNASAADTAPTFMTTAATPPVGVDVSGASLVRELEESTARAIDLIRRLDAARDRDEVIAIMVEHLALTHRRAGFFVSRANELALRTIVPAMPQLPHAALPLDRPSTLGDVVGTRLPYRGPALDETSRTFLVAALGACPPEILLVPITVRERVVGVLFAESRMKPTYDDQLGLAARAAGMAFERILAKKKA